MKTVSYHSTHFRSHWVYFISVTCHILRKTLSVWIFCLLCNLSLVTGQTVLRWEGRVAHRDGERRLCISEQFLELLPISEIFYIHQCPFLKGSQRPFLLLKISSISPYLCFSVTRRNYTFAKIIAHFRGV